MKRCSRCLLDLPLTAFSPHPHADQGVRPECKACRAEYARRRRQIPGVKERIAELQRRRLYDLPLGRFQEMLAEQGGRCAICRTDRPSGGWNVDHRHSTGAVRGILCGRCNRVLGTFHDDPDICRRAEEYLLAHNPCASTKGTT